MKVGDYIHKKSYLLLLRETETLRNELLLRNLWETGARVSELLNIKLKYCFDKKIYIKTSKGGIDRLVLATKKTWERMKQFIRKENLTSKDTLYNISRQRVYQIVKKISKNAKVKTFSNQWVHPHSFRHSRAIDFIDKGVSIERVGKYLGHKDRKTTYKFYLDFKDTRLRNILEGRSREKRLDTLESMMKEIKNMLAIVVK